uniref:Uncharacterized protein n=1 Tax=Nelumbo nucifera TaxID=4432 RepID=A0A822Y387_NELNU|nr:TPA_asm: hypothetical protein HUJ06_028190 [Nelumbo nucifera]
MEVAAAMACECHFNSSIYMMTEDFQKEGMHEISRKNEVKYTNHSLVPAIAAPIEFPN